MVLVKESIYNINMDKIEPDQYLTRECSNCPGNTGPTCDPHEVDQCLGD